MLAAHWAAADGVQGHTLSAAQRTQEWAWQLHAAGEEAALRTLLQEPARLASQLASAGPYLRASAYHSPAQALHLSAAALRRSQISLIVLRTRCLQMHGETCRFSPQLRASRLSQRAGPDSCSIRPRLARWTGQTRTGAHAYVHVHRHTHAHTHSRTHARRVLLTELLSTESAGTVVAHVVNATGSLCLAGGSLR